MKSPIHRPRGLRIEHLEDRQLLSVASPGDLLLTIGNPTPGAYDQFGAAVAPVGDKIVVGAPLDDTYGRDAGIAYLFDGTTGELLHTLPDPANATHPTLHNSDTFGAAVAAVGNNVLISAPLDDTGALNAGSVYLFDGTTGDLLHTFHNPEPDLGDQFGSTVLALGDDILIGALHDGGDAENAGSVYLFDGETRELLQKFPDLANPTHPVPVMDGEFGFDIAVIDDHRILIGACPLGPTPGAVFLFRLNDSTGAWDLERTVENPEPNLGERFGKSIAVAGDKVLIGASRDETYGRRAGIAHLFDASAEPWTWLNVPDPQNPTHPTLTGGEEFGTSAAAVGGNFLIGADQPFVGPGVAYLLDGASGDLLLTIPNPEPGTNDRFGSRVAALGDDLIVGAYLDDAGAVDAGSVYVFKGPEPGPGDTPPTISIIADQTVDEDSSTGTLSFTVGDAETDPGALVVTAVSSDQTLIPDANVILGGTGANRTIEVVPAADLSGGPVTITIAVSDGTNTTDAPFLVTVTPVNDAPSFTIGPDQSVPEDAGPQSVSGFATEMSAGPADESGQLLTFLVSSNNPALFAVQPAIDATTGRLTYTPALDANGVAVVMAQLKDDGGTAHGGVDVSPVLSFRIVVLSEQQQITNLLTQVRDLRNLGVLNGGQAKALSAKLNNVLKKLDRGNLKAAVNQLRAFINQVKPLVKRGVLSPEQGQMLIDAAQDATRSILTKGVRRPSRPAAVDAAFAELASDPFDQLTGGSAPRSRRK